MATRLTEWSRSPTSSTASGSDLRPYRGLQPINGPAPMGHQYCGVVEAVGHAVRSIKPGEFVIGSFAADAANAKPGSTVVVVGDSAVGLLGVLTVRQMGAERIIAMSRHERRQKLARVLGATGIVVERGDEGVQRITEMTGGVGADSALECVGTRTRCCRRAAVRAGAAARMIVLTSGRAAA